MPRKIQPSAEMIYQRLVSDAGLFGKAFFGHKKSRAEARKLRSLWHKAIMEGGTREQKEWLAQRRSGNEATEAERVHRAGEDESVTESSDLVSEEEEKSA